MRPLEGEGRNDDIAAAAEAVVDGGVKLRRGLIERPVQAISIGGLDHRHVGALGRIGVFQERPPRRPEIAGEDDALACAPFRDIEDDAGRAENVAGVDEGRTDARRKVDRLPVGAWRPIGRRPPSRPPCRKAARKVEPPRRPARSPALRASSSCWPAASRSTSRASSNVAEVAMISPLNPRLTSSGMRPQWSRWAWVSRSTSTVTGSKPKSPAFSASAFGDRPGRIRSR